MFVTTKFTVSLTYDFSRFVFRTTLVFSNTWGGLKWPLSIESAPTSRQSRPQAAATTCSLILSKLSGDTAHVGLPRRHSVRSLGHHIAKLDVYGGPFTLKPHLTSTSLLLDQACSTSLN